MAFKAIYEIIISSDARNNLVFHINISIFYYAKLSSCLSTFNG